MSAKLFMEERFVLKHIRNKHDNKVEEARQGVSGWVDARRVTCILSATCVQMACRSYWGHGFMRAFLIVEICHQHLNGWQ